MIENRKRILKITVFWDSIPSSLVHVQDVAEKPAASHINVEDRSSRFFLNFARYQPDYLLHVSTCSTYTHKHTHTHTHTELCNSNEAWHITHYFSCLVQNPYKPEILVKEGT